MSCIACCPCCFRSESSEAGDLQDDKPEGKWKFPALPRFYFKSKKVDGTPDQDDGQKEKKGPFGRWSIVDITRMSKREKIDDSPAPVRKSAGAETKRSDSKESDETPNEYDDSSEAEDIPERLKAPAVIRSVSHNPPRDNSSEEEKRRRRNSAEDIPLAMRISNFFQLRKDGPTFVTFNEDKNQYERTLTRTGKSV